MPNPIALALSKPARIALFAVFLALASGSARASESFAVEGGDPYKNGELVGFAGLSAGGFGTSGSFLIPPIHIGADLGITEYIGIGGMFAYSRYDYLKYGLQYMTFVARGTFHPIFWFEKMKIPLDPYFIASAGYTIGLWSGPGSADYGYVVVSPGVGARYWFKPNLAFQGESGFGFGATLASIGIAYKF